MKEQKSNQWRPLSFIVRFHQGSTGNGEVWLGQVEHIQSGEKRSFHGTQQLLEFMEIAMRASQVSSEATETDSQGGSMSAKNQFMNQVYPFVLLVVLSVALGFVAAVEAKTLNVANNGVDSATCGAVNTPCRSISQAIANASEGDRIIVGPGRYSIDLDNDGVFQEPGEEVGAFITPCGCMIAVTKPLTIESRDGAVATVLDASDELVSVVQIRANGVVFGKPKKGFTLTRARFEGLDITSVNSAKVSGNLAIANGTIGFRLRENSNGHVLNGNFAFANGQHGFWLDGGSGHLLEGNVAIANTHQGFELKGSGHQFRNNVASANGESGFAIAGGIGHRLAGNIGNGNSGDGFAIIGGSGHNLNGNSALGNKSFGIELFYGTSATVSKNNIFGNAPALSGALNCGLGNASGNSIIARNNFWGEATGPSGGEPADNVCDIAAGSSTTFAPFETKELKVKNKGATFLEETQVLARNASSSTTIYVANNGLDTPTCGSKESPCRSIGQAIQNANNSNKIVVGPGIYSPTEEPGPAYCGSCMILLNKPGLTIESRDGAATTVLDAAGTALHVVMVTSNGVVFGKKNKGFILTGAKNGYRGLDIPVSTTGVRITGNLAVANSSDGFGVNGSGHVLSNNLAIANGNDGFDSDGSGHMLSSNWAIANGDDGFNLNGSGHVHNSNVAIANADNGFAAGGSNYQFNGNVVSANGHNGFKVAPNSVLTGNSILGNGEFGIHLELGDSATVTKNNIYGNNPGGILSCGLFNESGGLIDASNNFWGASSGPGLDPADDGCLPAQPPGSALRLEPFVTKEFKVKTTTFLEEPGLVEPAESNRRETPVISPVQFLKETQTKEGLLFRALGDVSALRVEITDLSGREIYDSGLVKGEQLNWARVNSQNQPIANGVYLYRTTARDREGNEVVSELRKLVIRR